MHGGPLGTIFGCDLELIEPRSDAFVSDYFTADEKTLVHQTPVEKRALLLALIWSGKKARSKRSVWAFDSTQHACPLDLSDGFSLQREERSGIGCKCVIPPVRCSVVGGACKIIW